MSPRTWKDNWCDSSQDNSVLISLSSTQSSPRISKSWVFPVAVLASAIFISVFIGLAAKGRLIYRYLASYRHTLLPEVDEMDDDGFIEDNYIQDCERERAHLSI
uniref:Uncharacterized protein n=1 Tax=Paramormyrops kingsleyae TaxID=1676925 RepID=A0A3B3SLJ6_9TELE